MTSGFWASDEVKSCVNQLLIVCQLVDNPDSCNASESSLSVPDMIKGSNESESVVVFGSLAVKDVELLDILDTSDDLSQDVVQELERQDLEESLDHFVVVGEGVISH